MSVFVFENQYVYVVFKRSVLFHLEQWKADAHRKPLVLRGARQVGKTTVVNEFGKHFENYLLLNLEKKEARALFELEIPLKDLMPLLFAHCSIRCKEGLTLLFIDEIQNSPKAIGLLRYFYEELGTTDIMDAWRGMIAEHVVAQELLTLTDKVSQKRNFWMRGKAESPAEVDFIWVQDSRIYPIEVKTGHNAHLRSLHSFMNRSSQRVALRVWSKPYLADEVRTSEGKTFKLVNIPFYLVGALDKYLSTWK